MSGASKIGTWDLATRAAALVAIVVMAVGVGKLGLDAPPFAAPVAALGLLLLGGDLFSVLVEKIGLPHLTGYLIAGLLLGPHALHALSEHTVEQLSLVNALALALIALSAGSELTLDLLRQGLRSLLTSIAAQVLIAVPVSALGFYLLQPYIPFLGAVSGAALLGVAFLWGVISVSHSPAATLAIVAQVKPAGPLTRYTLGFVVSFEVVVLLLFAVALQVGKSLILGVSPDMKAMEAVGYEIVASVSFGITLGLAIAAYLSLTRRAVIFFVVALSYGVTLASQWLHYNTLLLFVVAGFVVANTSRVGDALMEGIAKGGRLVYVLFFAVAGAHLDLPLLGKLWPVALTLMLVRIFSAFVATQASARLAGDSAAIRRYGWMPLVSQAGVTIGMSVVLGATLPGFGPDLQALIIAVMGLNEAVGPVLFKYALDKTGESGKGAEQFQQDEAAT